MRRYVLVCLFSLTLCWSLPAIAPGQASLYGKQLTVQELDQMLEREKQRRIAANWTDEAAWNDERMVTGVKAQLVTKWANEVISDRIKATYPEPTPEAVQQRIELYQALGMIPSRHPIEVDVALRFGIEEILKVSDPTKADIDRVYEQVNRLVAAAGAPAVSSSQWEMVVDMVRRDGPGAYPTYVTQEEFLAPLRKTVSFELRCAALADSAMRHFQITKEGRLYQSVKQAIEESGWTGKISVEDGVHIVVAVRETVRLRMTVMSGWLPARAVVQHEQQHRAG